MIRQTISCDICGAEKKQTNHWFVAYTQADELRVSRWSSTHRLRSGTKHLCGQTCLHKLMDDFVAGKLTMRPHNPAVEAVEAELPTGDEELSCAAGAANPAAEIPAKIMAISELPLTSQAPAPVVSREPVTAAQSSATDTSLTRIAPRPDDSPSFASRRWRADAWQRERERELRSTGTTPRRKGF